MSADATLPSSSPSMMVGLPSLPVYSQSTFASAGNTSPIWQTLPHSELQNAAAACALNREKIHAADGNMLKILKERGRDNKSSKRIGNKAGGGPQSGPPSACIFQNIWVHGNSGGNGRSTEASQRRHGGAMEAVEAVEAPAEMAGRGVAETVEMLERLIKREGSQWQHEQTENRRKMHCEDGNGRGKGAGRVARPREGGAKEVGGRRAEASQTASWVQ
ncbi:hypothetical protein B0H14DRAFT_2631532 [Mycena olivaceomarginata]|nr:hypothetical protein B0H14DRAFT_2631532 [Mycena olivaceomarginata]